MTIKEFSLYNNIKEYGTLSENAQDIPNSDFALKSTINWMKALSIQTQNYSFQYAQEKYSDVNVRKATEKELNTIFEQLFLGLNQIAALKALSQASTQADVTRLAIVAWYYSIYASASAMIAAAEGSIQETHIATANQWDYLFAKRNLSLDPFSDRISSLEKSISSSEISVFKKRGIFTLINTPKNSADSWGCLTSYLSGCADWFREKEELKIKNSKEFQSQNFINFRSKNAQTYRDLKLSKKSICFLHQAFRYRGKANYRDAIFLAYGKNASSQTDALIVDLEKVARAFSIMAAAYVSKRINKEIWQAYLIDIEKNKAISISTNKIWSI